MKIGIVVEGQMGLTYAQQLALAQRAESLGFDAFYRTDHYESFPGPADQATSDAWSVLAGLARETKTIALGTLVSPVTFRYPGEYAKVVATVQEMADAACMRGSAPDGTSRSIVATASRFRRCQCERRCWRSSSALCAVSGLDQTAGRLAGSTTR